MNPNANVVHVCRDIVISGFSSFYNFIKEVMNDEDNNIFIDEIGPCYLGHLSGSEEVPKEFIPAVLEGACHYHPAKKEGILMVSVTSNEANHKDWIEQAENYPGATITVTHRVGRTCYCLLFTVTPAFQD